MRSFALGDSSSTTPWPMGQGFTDRIFVAHTQPLRFVDRVLLLFRPVCVSVIIDCENEVGTTLARSTVWAARWRWPWQHEGALEASRKASEG